MNSKIGWKGAINAVAFAAPWQDLSRFRELARTTADRFGRWTRDATHTAAVSLTMPVSRRRNSFRPRTLTLFAVLASLLAGCGGARPIQPADDGDSTGVATEPGDSQISISPIEDGANQANYDPSLPISLAPAVYLLRAEQATGPERDALLVDAVNAMLDRDAIDDAIAELAKIDQATLTPQLQLRTQIATARIEAERLDPSAAMTRLQEVRASLTATPAISAEALLAIAGVHETSGAPIPAANALIERASYLRVNAAATVRDRDHNAHRIWANLSTPDIVSLRRARNASTNADAEAWFQLAEIFRRYENQLGQRNQAVRSWRLAHQQHDANSVLPQNQAIGRIPGLPGGGRVYVAPSTVAPRQVALLLPLSSRFGKQAQAVYDGFVSMHELDQRPLRPEVVSYDIGADIDLVATYYQQAVADGADFVVGPLGRGAAEMLVNSGAISVPTLLLGASDGITGLAGGVYQFGLLPEDEARLVAARAFADGHRAAIVVTPSSEWGARLKGALSDAWTNQGGIVAAETNYTPGESRDFAAVVKRVLNIDDSVARHAKVQAALGKGNKVEFQPRRRQDVDVVLLMARSNDGRLLKPQINFFQGHDLPVYATSAIYDAKPNALSDADLDGTIFPEMPWIVSTDPALANLRSRVTRSNSYNGRPISRLFAFGMDAYGLLPALDRLRQEPRARFGGVSALLGVDATNSVTRTPVWAKFQQGTAVPLENSDSESNTDLNRQSDEN